jgi:hypothetical protein
VIGAVTPPDDVTGAGDVVTQYAAVEGGYQHEAEWTESRRDAEWESASDRAAGLDSYVITRTVTYSPWRPVGGAL